MTRLSKVLMAAALSLGAVFTISYVDLDTANAQSSMTVGGLRGVIRDKATKEPALGATVVATSPALVGEQVVLTDENGQYFIASLPPGVYTLTIYYENKTFSRSNVLVQLGKEAVINVTVDPAAGTQVGGGQEIIEISGTAPIIDQGSTKTGVTLTDDYTRNVPTGRTFAGVIGSAAGSQEDLYGVSLSGATSAENQYVVEGMNTTDTGFGGVSTNLPNEFILETEIITGGYNAEFGRATGGIVNVVTKSGSDTFKGSVFGYFTPASFVAGAEPILREGSSIDTETNLNYRTDFGAEVGGPIIPKRLWFHIGLNPSFAKQTTSRYVTSLKDDNMDGVPDVNPDTGFTERERIASSDIEAATSTYFFTGKINGAVNQNNQFQVSFFGNPRTGDALAGVVRNPNNAIVSVEDGAYDVAAKWTSKFNDGKTQVDAVLGFHRQVENFTPANESQNVPFVRYQYERSLYDFNVIESQFGNIDKCQDGGANDMYPMIRNCPVVSYASQGVDFLEERTNDRTAAVLSITQRVKAAGYHEFKAGIDADWSTYDSRRGYTGGARLSRSANTAAGAPGRWQVRELLSINRVLDFGTDPESVDLADGEVLCSNDRAVCTVAKDGILAETNNRSIAGYIQDKWSVRPNLTLSAGLRLEQQIGYVAESLQGKVSPENETIPEQAYNISDMLAPRLGVVYDPTSEGKGKLFAHWGRFYEQIPMDINIRAFGGEITNFTVYNQNRFTTDSANYDPNCDVDFRATTEANADLSTVLYQCQDRAAQALLGGGTEFVQPGLKGQYTQELVLGAEYEIFGDLTVGANYIHRTLPMIIEDISTDGGNHYLIANPGHDASDEAAELREKGEMLANSGDPEQMALGELYLSRAEQLEYVGRFDKPTRNYDALQLTAKKRFTKNFGLQASYTFSVSKGNYPGLFSTETGQLDPNLTSLYDLPDLMANRYGAMGLDRPHNMKVDGFYAFDLKKAGILVTGVSFRAQSGIPHNALGAHPTYGPDESYLVPRGAFERSPVTTQTDLHLAYAYQINKKTRVDFFIRLFNVFNSQDELDVDERYTLDNAVPVVGGTAEDLKHLKAIDINGFEQNITVEPNKNFGKMSARQAAMFGQLGFRLTF